MMIRVSALSLKQHMVENWHYTDLWNIYQVALAICDELGLEPNKVNANDGSFDAKMKTFGRGKHKLAVETQFEGFIGFSIHVVVDPKSSMNWDHDSAFSFGATFFDGMNGKMLILNTKVNEDILLSSPLDRSDIVTRCLSLRPWWYGHGMTADRELQPGTYVSGDGFVSGMPDEWDRRVNLWYSIFDERKRLDCIRDVFPCHVLRQEQLDVRLKSGGTLKDFIDRNTHSRLEPGPNGCFVWWVPENETETVRNLLLGEGILATE